MKKDNIKPQIKFKPNFLSLVVIITLSFTTTFTFGQDIKTERVSFNPDENSATLESSITGRETLDYILNVKEGQYMNVSLASKNGGVYFNIMEPGKQYEAFHIGSVKGNQYEGTTMKNGDYRIRVYLMKGVRNTKANYRLEMIVSGSGKSKDAKVLGTNYHATGEIPCKQGYGQPSINCTYGVYRKGNGSAEVTVTTADGSIRKIFFESEKAISYKGNKNYGDFKASREGYLYIIEIGNERYEIPDAVINGG